MCTIEEPFLLTQDTMVILSQTVFCFVYIDLLVCLLYIVFLLLAM